MKLTVIDNANNKTLFNLVVSDNEALYTGLDIAEKRLKDYPNYEKGCYTIIQSIKGITYNVFAL
jgi:hypothetical protein